MGIGRFIIRQMVGAPVRRHGGLVETAVASASAAAAGAFVANVMNNRQQAQQQAINYNSSAPVNKYQQDQRAKMSNYLGKLACCYYIARADGMISREEQLELDRITTDFIADPMIADSYKADVQRISTTNMSFNDIRPYLEKTDTSVLVYFMQDIDSVARANGNISDQEDKAIENIRRYIEVRTGQKLERNIRTGPNTVDLVCDHCGGAMDIDETFLHATCPFCGSQKIIDTTQINKLQN